jgi:hypothetical protein
MIQNEAGEEWHPAVLTEVYNQQTVADRVDDEDENMKYKISMMFNPVLARHLSHSMAAGARDMFQSKKRNDTT